MIVISIILTTLVIVLGYTTFNLLRKNEKLEERINQYEEFINDFSEIIEFSDNKIKEIDSRGTFNSDDEIGWFFNNIKEIQNLFNSFNLRA
jgi:cell division protein FtsL